MTDTQQPVPGRLTTNGSKWVRDLLDDPDYWLARAEEDRAIGSQYTDERCRAAMENIAREHEYLARQAERRRRLTWSEP